METTLGCSPSCADVREPFKLSSGCGMERYLMRQRYLRSYPLKMTKETEKAGNVVKRTMQWLKQKKRKFCRSRFDDQGKKQPRLSSEGEKKSKPNTSSSYLVTCLKLLLVCMAKVDRCQNGEPETYRFLD